MRFLKEAFLGRDISVLGFGSAAVLGRVGKSESLRALETAFDVGINVFDTARAYGYGESEALLGEFFKGRRSEVVICSKFGIMPAAQSALMRMAKPVARMVLQAVPSMRKRIRGQVAAQFNPGQFTVSCLHESVHTSLKKLRTDYLDILFMHEASSEAVANHDLLQAMEKLVQAGKVRLLGVAAEAAVVIQALGLPAIQAVQFPSNVGNRFARDLQSTRSAKSVLRFANHPFGGQQGAASLEAKFRDVTLPRELRRKVLSADRHEVLADIVLNSALQGNDVVLTTMMKPEHIRLNSNAVTNSRFNSEELEIIRNWLAGTQAKLQEAGSF